MPVYDAANVPDTVGRGTLDPELAAWLPSGPTLGADVPIAAGHRDHMQLGVAPTSSPSGALVYIHGGGFTYGTLDEFEVPMRLIAERAGILTYIVDYQLAPEAKYPTRSRRSSTSCAGCSTMPPRRGSTRPRSASAATRPAAT